LLLAIFCAAIVSISNHKTGVIVVDNSSPLGFYFYEGNLTEVSANDVKVPNKFGFNEEGDDEEPTAAKCFINCEKCFCDPSYWHPDCYKCTVCERFVWDCNDGPNNEEDDDDNENNSESEAKSTSHIHLNINTGDCHCNYEDHAHYNLSALCAEHSVNNNNNTHVQLTEVAANAESAAQAESTSTSNSSSTTTTTSTTTNDVNATVVLPFAISTLVGSGILQSNFSLPLTTDDAVFRCLYGCPLASNTCLLSTGLLQCLETVDIACIPVLLVDITLCTTEYEACIALNCAGLSPPTSFLLSEIFQQQHQKRRRN
jgi:hypothetical protein